MIESEGTTMREGTDWTRDAVSSELVAMVAQGLGLPGSSEVEMTDELKRALGQGLYKLAKTHYDKADLSRAEELFTQSLKYSEMPRDAFSTFKTYGFLIRIYSEKQDSGMGHIYVQKAQSLLDELSSGLGTLNAEFFYNSGTIRMYQGEFESAVESFEIAYRKGQEENESELVAKSLYSLSLNLYRLGRLEDALEYVGRLSQVLEILNKDYLKGAMYILSGNILRDQGKYHEALDHYQKAIDTLQSKSCWNLYCYVLLNKGVTYKKLGEFDKALMFFDLAHHTVNNKVFCRLNRLIQEEVEEVNDSSVDLYLDRHNRIIYERSLGPVDFNHRFVLLEILFLLASHPGRFFDKEELARRVWKDEYNPLIHDKLIYTSVSRLRKLIEPKDEKRKYILRGKDGYTFNPRVKARFHREHSPGTSDGFGNVELSSPV